MLSDNFRSSVEACQAAGLSERFREDLSSAAQSSTAYQGRGTVLKSSKRRAVLGLGGNFRYVHQLEDSDARVAILEFGTEWTDVQVERIDMLAFTRTGASRS